MEPKAKISDPSLRRSKGVAEDSLVKEGSGYRIRPELNIEKWPAIWRPARSTRKPTARLLEREKTGEDGTRTRARVEVGYTHLGELTTEDQRTYYALVKQWELSGRPAKQAYFSIRGLARILRRGWGTNVIDAVTASLRRLRATPITWENAYFDAGHHETLQQIETINILSELKIVRKRVDGHITTEAGYFRFNDLTLRNLISNHTKPVLLDAILRFETGLAQLLYSHLDLVMADKSVYERRTSDLCRDLGLEGIQYRRVYERKRALMRAVAELTAVPLTTGTISRISIVKTHDEMDYKLKVTKSGKLPTAIPDPADAREGIASPIESVSSASENLVRHFHKSFHGVDRHYPQSKELSQATTLIAQHGFDKAKFIVDYARTAAAETRFNPQTFGGILQYTSRALYAQDVCERQQEAARKAQATARAREEFDAIEAEITAKRRTAAEARLRELPPAELGALTDKAKTSLLRFQWLSKDQESPTFQRLLRMNMISNLMREIGESDDVGRVKSEET